MMAKTSTRTLRCRLYPKPAQEALLLRAIRAYGERQRERGETAPPNLMRVAFKDKDRIERNRVYLSGLGWVNAKCWQEIDGSPVSCTISRDGAGRWWAAFGCVGAAEEPLAPASGSVTLRFGRNGNLGKVARSCRGGLGGAGAVERIAYVESGHSAKANTPGASAVRSEERRMRMAGRALSRREGAGGGPRSARFEEQLGEVAALRAHRSDSARTQACQIAATLLRDYATVIVRGRPSTDLERELLRRLRERCRQPGCCRQLIERDP